MLSRLPGTFRSPFLFFALWVQGNFKLNYKQFFSTWDCAEFVFEYVQQNLQSHIGEVERGNGCYGTHHRFMYTLCDSHCGLCELFLVWRGWRVPPPDPWMADQTLVLSDTVEGLGGLASTKFYMKWLPLQLKSRRIRPTGPQSGLDFTGLESQASRWILVAICVIQENTHLDPCRLCFLCTVLRFSLWFTWRDWSIKKIFVCNKCDPWL